MLKLNHLLGGLPPAVVDHQLLLVAVATVAYWLILGYYKGESRKVRNLILTDTLLVDNPHNPQTLQLTHIPSTESDLPLFSFRGSFKYLFDARKLIKSSLQKVSIHTPATSCGRC